MSEQAVTAALFDQLARVGKAISSPRRVELLDILGQGERSVESLADATGMTVGNTSSHLQVLRQASLVNTRRRGTKIMYSLAGERVALFLRELWSLADDRLAEVEKIIRAYLQGEESLERVSRDELVSRSLRGDVMIIDVRPTEEYAAGHIPSAVSVPFDSLDEHLADLPREVDIVAYCRGPYCILAPKAAQILRQRGYRIQVLEDGLPEWRRAGLPVTADAA